MTSLQTVPTPSGTSSRSTWFDITRITLLVGIVSTIAFAVIATGWTTSDGGDFAYPADYWYTALGLPLAAVGLLLALGVYRLQSGATGRRGKVGVWINSVCFIVLFTQGPRFPCSPSRNCGGALCTRFVRWVPSSDSDSSRPDRGVSGYSRAGCWGSGRWCGSWVPSSHKVQPRSC